MMDERSCYMWLSCFAGISAATAAKLLAYFHTPQEIWQAAPGAFEKVPGLQAKTVRQLQRAKREPERIQKEMWRLENLGGRYITLADEDYPKRLRAIDDPPPGLYLYGVMPPEDMPLIAVIGARGASEYGISAAEHFAMALAQVGIGVVSGLARGVDGAAHRGALSAARPLVTWGVMGTGLNVAYPSEHYPMIQEMRDRGGVITEYPLDDKALAWHFPVRNRIISGLSDGVLVLQSRISSGTNITADCALEQGRNVYALPGPFNSKLSEGCHRLIQNGAKLVMNPMDIIEDYEGRIVTKNTADIHEKIRLAHSEKLVYAILSLSPQRIETIARGCGLSVPAAMGILVQLELKGYARRIGVDQYVLRMQKQRSADKLGGIHGKVSGYSRVASKSQDDQ